MKKKINNEYKKEIPLDIKILFGKFYFFSFLYLLFFFFLFPLFLMKHISIYSTIGIFIVFIVFFIYIIYDLLKKKKNFQSSLFLPLCVFMLFSIIHSLLVFYKLLEF